MAAMPLKTTVRLAMLGAGLWILVAAGASAGAYLSLTHAATETASKVAFSLIGGGALLLTLGGTIALLVISNGLLRRLLMLRGILQQLGHGQLDAEIPIPAGGEMGDILRELHHLRLGLVHSMGEAARLKLEAVAAEAHLDDRVAERTQALLAANTELEAFSHAVSHDLRAPLRTMAGFSKALLDDYGPRLDEDGRVMLGRVHRAAGHMSQLVEDLLTLSRLNRKPEISDADLSGLASRIGQTLQEAAPGRAVRLKIEPGIHARCDARLIEIALTNLIDNAWKFTAHNPAPVIEFGQRLDAGRQSFFVRDNGAGFDMAYRHKLFVPFERLHSAETFPGSGIGLSTVKRIIGIHGGEVWAEGKPGEGATFTFQLGTAADQQTIAPSRPAASGARPETERRVVQLRAGVKE